MNRDEIRKLLGGYATGTLTEAEREALFTAALDDQELFDELAREQALKEILDAPGARDRLAAALRPPDPPLAWWKGGLVPWAVAGTAAAGLLVAFVLLRAPQRTQVAVTAPAESQARLDRRIDKAEPADKAAGKRAAEAQFQAPAPQPTNAKESAPATLARGSAKLFIPGAVPQPAPPIAPEPPKEEALKKTGARAGESLDAEANRIQANKAVRDEKDSEAKAQAADQVTVTQQAPSGVGRQQAGIASGALGGVGGGAVTRVVPVAPLAPPAPVRTAPPAMPQAGFDYSIQHDSVSVRPLTNGLLTVTALAAGKTFTLQSESPVQVGSSLAIAIPPGSMAVTLDFLDQSALAIGQAFRAADAVTVTAESQLVQTLPTQAVQVENAPAPGARRQDAAKRAVATPLPVAPKQTPAAPRLAAPLVSTEKSGRVAQPIVAGNHVTITLAVPKE